MCLKEMNITPEPEAESMRLGYPVIPSLPERRCQSAVIGG